MKSENNRLVSFILIIALLFGSFPAIVSATNNSEIKNNYDTYNCYAYAIGRFEETTFYWPGSDDGKPYQPGDMCKINPSYDGFDGNIYTLTTLVQNDLTVLGFTNILIHQSDDDDYNINSNEIDTYSQLLDSIDFDTQELICVRIATQTEYHFMKYDAETNAWYNKIGYDEIYKYVDNNGIPANDVYWVSSTHTYNGDIAYIVYDKLQINVDDSGYASKNIVIQGCETGYSARDAFYEIVVPESGCYTIEIETPTIEASRHEGLVNFNYEIYSYNMYNGNYSIVRGSGVSGQTFTQTVNLTAYDDYNDGSEGWPYQAYKHYIRLDFERGNTSDETVNVSITRQHSYTDHYESISSTQHKAYCQCGEYELQNHDIIGDACCSCGEAHTHEYTDHYEQDSYTQHKAYCWCGESIIQDHNYSNYISVDKTYHTSVCACGASNEPEEHYASDYVPIDSSRHYVYCECGYMEEEFHTIVPGSKPLFSACRDCGYIRENNPGAVIKGEKENPETESE